MWCITPQYQPTPHLEPHVLLHISHSRIPIIQVSADFRSRLKSVREGDQEKSPFRTPLRRITRLPLCRCYSAGASMPIQGVKTISNRRRRVTPVAECDRECPPSIPRHIWRRRWRRKSQETVAATICALILVLYAFSPAKAIFTGIAVVLKVSIFYFLVRSSFYYLLPLSGCQGCERKPRYTDRFVRAHQKFP